MPYMPFTCKDVDYRTISFPTKDKAAVSLRMACVVVHIRKQSAPETSVRYGKLFIPLMKAVRLVVASDRVPYFQMRSVDRTA